MSLTERKVVCKASTIESASFEEVAFLGGSANAETEIKDTKAKLINTFANFFITISPEHYD